MSLAPSIPMFGSFFPAWLLCLLGAVVLTMILRGLFVAVGLDDVLRWKVAVYVSMMLIVNYIILSLVFNS
ncbi:YtcA family lipoprotein [Hoeflea sp. CAU 1731]